MDHVDDGRTNSEESMSNLSNGANIVYPVCFFSEKDELHYPECGSLKHENLTRCELSSGEVSLKKAMMNNLESDDPSLVAVERLKIMISDKDAHSTDVLYHQHCCNKFTRDHKPAKSNWEEKDNAEKGTAEKGF